MKLRDIDERVKLKQDRGAEEAHIYTVYRNHLEDCFDFSIGPGWIPMVEELMEKLLETDPLYKVNQVKEKFGTLRFYTAGLSEKGWELVAKAERQSGKTCEDCGMPGKVKSFNGWLKCLCKKCAAEREKK